MTDRCAYRERSTIEIEREREGDRGNDRERARLAGSRWPIVVSW